MQLAVFGMPGGAEWAIIVGIIILLFVPGAGFLGLGYLLGKKSSDRVAPDQAAPPAEAPKLPPAEAPAEAPKLPDVAPAAEAPKPPDVADSAETPGAPPAEPEDRPGE